MTLVYETLSTDLRLYISEYALLLIFMYMLIEYRLHYAMGGCQILADYTP